MTDREIEVSIQSMGPVKKLDEAPKYSLFGCLG